MSRPLRGQFRDTADTTIPHLVMTGIVGIFIPFSRTVDLLFAILGCLIFSGYIVYDTFMITKRLSPDEYIAGSLSLYLEYVLLLIPLFFIICSAVLTTHLLYSRTASSTCVSDSFILPKNNLGTDHTFHPHHTSCCVVLSILRLLSDLQDR